MRTLTTLCICIYITTAGAGEPVWHKGSRLNATVHHVDAAGGWATISAQESSGQHFKVWLHDLDTGTRVRLGVASPGETLQYNTQQQQAAEMAALQQQQAQEAAMRAAAQQAAAEAGRRAAAAEAQRVAMERQLLDLQRRQTEAMEQSAFAAWLRSQQR